MFAVIRAGGKQYRVAQGEVIAVEKFEGKVGDKIQLGEVLAVSNGDSLKLGQPLVSGAHVDAEIVAEVKGPKVISFKKQRRQGKRWKKGHRQQLLQVRIDQIVA